MPVDPKRQLLLLLVCVLSGFAAGIVYDLFRALRRRYVRAAVTAALDLLFCIAWFTVMFLIGYTACDGVQRFYAPLFSALGAALYFYGFSPLLLPVFEKFTGLVSSFLKFILSPFSFALKKVKKYLFF